MTETHSKKNAPKTPANDDKTQTANKQARDLKLASALVEHFDPIQFGEIFVDKRWRADALASLSEHCDEVEHEGSYHWQLHADFRRKWLNKHNNTELFLSLLEKTNCADTDLFTRYLKIGFSGQLLSDELEKVEADYQAANKKENNQRQKEKNKIERSEQLHAILKAARLIDMLKITTSDGAQRTKDMGQGEDPSEARIIRRQIERNAALDALDSLANKDTKLLFGRQRELRKLVRFRNTDLRDAKNVALRLCVITGVGGAGKSALLARYIYRHRNQSNMPPLIYFDFDRSSLSAHNTLALTFEFTRQLALYVPELDLPLVQFRTSQRSEDSQVLCKSLGDILSRWPSRESAVTLVIDTFEEVALQGPEAVGKILDWLRALRDYTQLSNLHVIVTGRAMPDTLINHKLHILSRLRLGDLHKDAAKLLLTTLKIDTDIAGKAVDTFGGNPLVLHMFARFCESKPQEVDTLLSDVRERKRSAPSGELALYFLFERILVRISDEKIKRLASPGLTLRYITSDLIKHVLAEPCGLGEISDEEAKNLFDRLASHVWLVRQDGDRLLGQHRDLRRMMLPGIHENNLSNCEKISRKAVHYFDSNPTGVLEEDAWIEAAYHRGFLGEHAIPNKVEDARKIIKQLGADLHDWPPHTIELIKHVAQKTERLPQTQEDRIAIEHKHGIFSRANQAAELVCQKKPADEFPRAPQSVERLYQLDDADLSVNESYTSSNTIRFLFNHGLFDQISPKVTEAMRPLFRQRDALAVTHYWRDDKLLYETPWLVALAFLAEPDYGLETSPIIPLSTVDAVLSTPRRVAIETTFELFYMLAIAELIQDQHAISSLNSVLDSYLPGFSPPIYNLAQLKVLQISANSQRCNNLIGSQDVIQMKSCNLLQWRSLMMEFDDNTHPNTRINRLRNDRVQRLLAVDSKRLTLLQLDSLRSALNEHSIEVLGPQGLDQLHSLHPELYAPIRFALSSAAPRDIYHTLVILSEKSNFWPVELTPRNEFVDNGIGFSRLQLNTIIETADRCNLLEFLLKSISELGENPFMRDELCLLTRLNEKLTRQSSHADRI